VPVLGNLFRTETRNRKKTNLMVFLRPIVVRDSAQTDELSLDRYDLMRGKQENAQPIPSSVVPVNESPLLPPLTRPRTAPGTTTPPSPVAPVSPQTAPSAR
jgi:general secretion pathway protein D